MSFTGYLIFSLALIVLSVSAAVIGVVGTRRRDILDWPMPLAVGGIVVALFVWVLTFVVCLITFLFIPIGAHYSHVHCDRFGEGTEREVKWSRYTYASWDCLVRTDEGWVGIDRVVKVDD